MNFRPLAGPRYWLLYPFWVALCVVLMVAMRNLADDSESGRIGSEEASRRAVSELQRVDPARYAGYEVVSAAWSRKGELGPEARWVVLCDRAERSALREAVVVELRGDTGALIRLRSPSELKIEN